MNRIRFTFAKDRWDSKDGLLIPYDKVEHFLSYFALTIFLSFFAGPPAVFVALLVAGVVWEVKDAIVSYRRNPFWGGDGFSWKDLLANFAGMLLGALLMPDFLFAAQETQKTPAAASGFIAIIVVLLIAACLIAFGFLIREVNKPHSLDRFFE